MELQELIDKASKEGLSENEQEELLTQMNEKIVAIRENDPEKYLTLMASLNEILVDLHGLGKEV